jgi:hypothetical protein
MNINKFAFNVGRMGRKVREAANPFHKAYTGATPEQAAQLRKEWMLGHLTGQGLKAAERILSKGKSAGADAEHIKAIDRASSDFRYMVVRPVKTETNGAGMADPVAALLKAYAELTGAQKRKFKASI